jgi:hypothetical protein
MCPIFLRLARPPFATIEDRLSCASKWYENMGADRQVLETIPLQNRCNDVIESSVNRADDNDPKHSVPCGLLDVLHFYGNLCGGRQRCSAPK